MLKKAINCINPNLVSIYKKTAALTDLAQGLSKYLPEHLKTQVTVTGYEKGVMILCCRTPSASTELRYLLPELRNQLRSKEKLYALTNIKIITDHT